MHELLNLNHQLIFYDFKIHDDFSRTSGFCSHSSKIKSFWLVHCVCVFILFHLLVSSGYTTSVTYVRSSDQWSFVVSISRGFYQVPSSLFLNLSYFKLQPTAYWREKRYDLMFALEKMIYVDTGYKSAHYRNR